ncbi:DUF6252 family protein [Dyadobacter psychrotolerans]|uniref:Uncharacterized protein n=1 Tax=Dyadobacter psychrotolerans TaxID=2541721 RepID=A0A4R5E061_9BACT|nr:DUF6252 family protein [Dyadobacter psychrotolerans]TDE18364.1 hypothetical protein E0F88_02145 [Dyadobacter psychrotolerans]
MKKTNLYTTALVALLLIWGCDKGPELTPLTQEGKNTFSCKVNGKVWIPDGRGSIFVNIPPIDGGFFRGDQYSISKIWISTYSSDNQEVHLFLETIDVGPKNLDRKTHPYGASFQPSNYGLYRNSQQKEFITSNINTGTITLIKADTLTGIISGTFEFTAANSSGNVTKITDGRFDINSKTL